MRLHALLNLEACQRDAACAGMDSNIFFAEKGQRLDEAKAVCADCPVKRECLECAIRNRERVGVWGGLTPKQRRSVIKMRKALGQL